MPSKYTKEFLGLFYDIWMSLILFRVILKKNEFRCKGMVYMAFVFIQGLTQCFIKTIDFTCGKILLKIRRFSLKESQNGENSPTKGPQ